MLLCSSVDKIEDFHYLVYAADNGVILIDKTGELTLKNLLNLFNSSWGVIKYLNPALGSDQPRVLKYEGVDKDGYATFSTPKSVSGSTATFEPYHNLGQCWYASVGIKYLFN